MPLLMKRYRLFAVVLISMLLSVSFDAVAQELQCSVEVNSSSIEGTNKSVFNALQESISEYLNETKWSNMVFAPSEKIDCRLFLTVKEYADDRVKGDLQLQLIRPVFNSTYTTTLFNFKDTKIEFDYREGDPLIFNEGSWGSNLTGILDFYAYLFLALDSDSFSPRGGQPYFDKMATVVQLAQSSGEAGWRTFEDTRNRSALLSSFTDSNTGMIRDLFYQYHRKGLDEMATSPDKGRAAVTSSLQAVADIYKNAPMSVALSLFRDAKLDELVNIYSKAPQTERELVYDLLKDIYPTDGERLEKIRKPDDL